MKVKRQKRIRRSVRFYSTCFGFREPFKILCDGTFTHHLLVNQITSAGDALSGTLGAPTKLFTTRCIVEELKSLGNSYSESFMEARALFPARCDHEKRVSAARCIEDVVGEKNSEHFFVATQDTDLRKKFREIPGVPVIFARDKSLFLEPPSESQRHFVISTEEERLHATEMERKILQKRRYGEVATDRATDSPDAHEDLGNQVLRENVSIRKNTSRRMSNLADKPQFKRNKAKGPNPLSCKKKKSSGNPSIASNQESRDRESASRKRNRKRKRSGNGIQVGENDS